MLDELVLIGAIETVHFEGGEGSTALDIPLTSCMMGA